MGLVPLSRCFSVIGGDFDFVLFYISINLLADSSPLFIRLFLLYVVRRVWGKQVDNLSKVMLLPSFPPQ